MLLYKLFKSRTSNLIITGIQNIYVYISRYTFLNFFSYLSIDYYLNYFYLILKQFLLNMHLA